MKRLQSLAHFCLTFACSLLLNFVEILGETVTRWSAPTDFDTVCRRAAGRRHYNSLRQFHALLRRRQVIELVGRYGLFTHGAQARIAQELGVSEATISRDIACLLRLHVACPCCGSLVSRDRLPGAKRGRQQ